MAGKKTKVVAPKERGAPTKARASTQARASTKARVSIGAAAATKLPAALAKRAEEQAAAKRDRLVNEGRADIALIRRRQGEIAEAFSRSCARRTSR